MFSKEFCLGFPAVVPALVILVCALLRANVKLSMVMSILASVLVCIFYQGLSLADIARFSLLGFTAKDPDLAMLGGGGVVSMLRVTAIVCISSLYSGIFRETGLLSPVTRLIEALSKKVSKFAIVLIVALVTGAVACNQTLSIMLSHQICGEFEKDNGKMSIFLENSAVVVAPLVPWSIACATVFDSSGAPGNSFVTALFLFLVPLWSLLCERIKYYKET
jgi:NhaC family Na+:H+ antiporter